MTQKQMKIPSKREVMSEMARRNLMGFALLNVSSLDPTPFHSEYYKVLELFARGKIRKLIISIPPQHGKSLGSSVLLPAYMLGLNPNLRICIASYSLSLASKFNRQVQRIIDSRSYASTFPNTKIKSSGTEKTYVRTNEEFEIVGMRGSLLSVGREGALTGNQVDVMIIDDLYKDAMEANSEIIRANAWDWYMSVVKTRLHNDSQEIIVFTRWHENDIIGMIAEREKVIDITSSAIETWNKKHWYRLNFEALKSSVSTPVDPREMGEPLWEARHSRELLEAKRTLDNHLFECMYQGNPTSVKGLLYGDKFKTYDIPLTNPTKKANYTDCADTGSDYLCSICYDVQGDKIYVTDIVYTQQSMEYTESAVASMLLRNNTRIAYIESNNGGRSFARSVKKLAPKVCVEWFNQSANKESRILTNSRSVASHVVFPADWRIRWSEFYRHVTEFRREFKSNRHDDAADTLTGIIEREPFSDTKVSFIGFSK